MRKAFATYSDGRVVFDSPVDWPDGMRVVVSPRAAEEYGLDESEWPESPEKRESWLAWFDLREPLDLTPEQREAIEADRSVWKEQQIGLVRRNWPETDEHFE